MVSQAGGEPPSSDIDPKGRDFDLRRLFYSTPRFRPNVVFYA
jgi:hypothetical protein